MSTLRTYNLQNPDSSNVNIELTQGSGAVVAGVATFSSNVTVSGNLTVGGELTYEDVTNVDSVGLITARSGISITGGDLTIPDAIIHDSDTNTRIRFPASDTFTVETAGNERLRISSNGRIGIATDNPGAILDVEGTLLVGTSGVANGNTTLNGHVIVDRTGVSGSNPWLTVKASGSSVFYVNGAGSVYANGVNATGGITAGTSGQGDGNSNIYGYLSVDRNGVAASNTWFQVKNGSTPILYADGNGKFGVGTNSPSVNLHVKGSASNGQIYLGGTGAHSQIYADNDGVLILNADQGNSAANSYLGFNVDNSEKLRITSGGIVDVTGKLRIDISNGGTAGSGTAEGIFLRNTQETDNNAVTIFGGADDYNAAASAINFINVDHSANAGDISFDTRSTSNSYAERLRILNDGTITTGGLSSTPGTVAAGSIISAAANAGVFVHGYDGKFGTSSNHPLYFQTNGVTKATITAAGAFSVGTTSPQQPNVPSIHLHSTANDDARIAITTPSKPNSRIGYFGLSNKFGMDVYNGFEVRDVGSSYATRFAINSTGVVTFGGQSYASATKSGGVNVSSSCYFDITGSSYVFVKIMIKVGYSGNASYQMHAQYDYVTCNYYTTGSTATRTDILQVEAANAQFNYSDISISRPSNRTVRVTYAPSSGAGTHHPILYVSGVFDSITVS